MWYTKTLHMKAMILSVTFISLVTLNACSQSSTDGNTDKPVGEYCEKLPYYL